MDRKKYIIEVSDDIQRLMAIGVAEDKTVFTCEVKVDALEELNSDYINKHYGELQDKAYQQELKDGKKAFDLLDAERDSEYQRGLDDAWEAARKISLNCEDGGIDGDGLREIFGTGNTYAIIQSNTAQEAIEKIKAYEDKYSDRIEVGDEVKWNSDVIVITRVYEDGGFNWCDGISQDGRAFHVLAENVRKTGRHFDIGKILEEMKE